MRKISEKWIHLLHSKLLTWYVRMGRWMDLPARRWRNTTNAWPREGRKPSMHCIEQAYHGPSIGPPCPPVRQQDCSVQARGERERETRPFPEQKRWDRTQVGPGLHQISGDHLGGTELGERKRFDCAIHPKAARRFLRPIKQARWTDHGHTAHSTQHTAHSTQHTAHSTRHTWATEEEGYWLLWNFKNKIKTPAFRHLQPRCPGCDKVLVGQHGCVFVYLGFRPMCVLATLCMCSCFLPGVWSDDFLDVCVPGVRGPGGDKCLPSPNPRGLDGAVRRCKTVSTEQHTQKTTHIHVGQGLASS